LRGTEGVQKRVRRAESEEMEVRREIIAKISHVLKYPRFSKDRTANNKYGIKGIIICVRGPNGAFRRESRLSCATSFSCNTKMIKTIIK
jgi:hypothetical protein